MVTRLRRSVDEPIREGLTWSEKWEGPDKGLIWCWQRGRQKRVEEPELATRADKGELVMLAWKGGVQKKGKKERKRGTLQYLATWQGLRGEDLNIDTGEKSMLTCTATKTSVVFTNDLRSTLRHKTGGIKRRALHGNRR